jgi:hypothetical protein
MNGELLTLLAATLVVVCVFYSFGRAHGVGVERQRIESLCHQAVIKRASGSVRWVWNAVSSGQKELAPEEKFFGPLTEEDRIKRSER